MTQTRIGLRTLLAGAIAVALAGAAAAQDTPRRGGTLVVGTTSEQRILNPAIRASTGVYLMASKIVEPLLDTTHGGVEPLLATEWSSSADGKTITFKLRQGVKWHDGKDFTSRDVRFSALECWKKILNYGTTLFLYLDDVETPDAHTAVFKFSRPMPMDLMLRAMPDLGHVIPAHLYEGTDINQNPYNNKPVGTGPFKFVEYQRGQYIIADRNPDYWRKGHPYLDRVVWRFITDKSAMAAAIEAEQVHIAPFMGVPMSDIARFAKDPRFMVGTMGYEGNVAHTAMEMNLRRKELSDVRVRRALFHALDIDFVIKNIFLGYGKRGTGPIPSTSPDFYTTDVPSYPFDKAKAEGLLDEAGYKRGADGNRFALKLVPAPWGEYTLFFAQYIQQALGDVGVKVEIQQFDAAGFLRSVYRDHAFDLTTGWHQYRNDPAVSTTVWYRSGSPVGTPWSNQYGYLNPRMDEVIDAAAFELDRGKRRALYHEFQRLALEDLPVAMAIEHPFVSVTNKKVQNSHNTPRWASSTWWDTWLKP